MSENYNNSSCLIPLAQNKCLEVKVKFPGSFATKKLSFPNFKPSCCRLPRKKVLVLAVRANQVKCQLTGPGLEILPSLGTITMLGGKKTTFRNCNISIQTASSWKPSLNDIQWYANMSRGDHVQCIAAVHLWKIPKCKIIFNPSRTEKGLSKSELKICDLTHFWMRLSQTVLHPECSPALENVSIPYTVRQLTSGQYWGRQPRREISHIIIFANAHTNRNRINKPVTVG